MKRIDLFKDAFAITCGYFVAKVTLEAAASVFCKRMDSWAIKRANEGSKEAREFCKKWKLKYNDWDKSMADDLNSVEVFFHNREEVEALMTKVHSDIFEHGMYRVRDLREDLGISSKTYDDDPGWANPDCCNILKEGSLYILHFEPAIDLEGVVRDDEIHKNKEDEEDAD